MHFGIYFLLILTHSLFVGLRKTISSLQKVLMFCAWTPQSLAELPASVIGHAQPCVSSRMTECDVARLQPMNKGPAAPRGEGN